MTRNSYTTMSMMNLGNETKYFFRNLYFIRIVQFLKHFIHLIDG